VFAGEGTPSTGVVGDSCGIAVALSRCVPRAMSRDRSPVMANPPAIRPTAAHRERNVFIAPKYAA
jgi:hypothetical protein